MDHREYRVLFTASAQEFETELNKLFCEGYELTDFQFNPEHKSALNSGQSLQPTPFIGVMRKKL